MGEMRSAHSIFVGKPEGKRPLGKHRRSWEDKGVKLTTNLHLLPGSKKE
jgi:hypothetical protein